MSQTRIRIRPLTFWPACIVMILASVMSLTNGDRFAKEAGSLVKWILNNFSWGFSATALIAVIMCTIAFVSPLGSVRIGGKDAEKILTPLNWVMVALCTTVAAGLLFWASAEPLYHYYATPKGVGITPQTPEAAKFALSTMFLHWSFTPYAIYCIPAVVFAITYHNLGKPFSIGAMLYPVFGNRIHGKVGEAIDGLALSSFSASMASSLATGILAIMGGLVVLGIPKSPYALTAIAIVIGITVIASSVSGIKKGITFLSTINTYVFVALGIIIFVFGPSLFILNFGLESFGSYVDNFFHRSLITGAAENDSWAKDWTIFYFSSWMAWAPLTAMFLGKISRGYTVRHFLIVNLLVPSLFAGVWTSIFGGTTLFFDIFGDQGAAPGFMKTTLDTKGYESVIYTLFSHMPAAGIMIVAFIFATYLSYCTAADSTTHAMANICVEDSEGQMLTEENSGSNPLIIGMKVLWGSAIGIIAITMLIFADVSGIKQLAYIGGLPALFLCIAMLISLGKMMFYHEEYFGHERQSAQS